MTGFAKRGLIHASNFSTLEVCNLSNVLPIALKFVASLSYHSSYLRENFNLKSYSQMKLCLYKVTQSNPCIRPLFANSVTYSVQLLYVCAYNWDVLNCDTGA